MINKAKGSNNPQTFIVIIWNSIREQIQKATDNVTQWRKTIILRCQTKTRSQRLPVHTVTWVDLCLPDVTHLLVEKPNHKGRSEVIYRCCLLSSFKSYLIWWRVPQFGQWIRPNNRSDNFFFFRWFGMV